MTTPFLTRRASLVAGAAALAALVPRHESTAAEPLAMSPSEDWFASVQLHHTMIAKTFDRLLDAQGRLYATRDRLLKLLKFQLTAHSVAEENTIYPMLATLGMTTEADTLYLDQAHAKILNAQIDMSTIGRTDDTTWVGKVKALQAAVLRHAKDDEEAKLFPALRARLDDSGNAMLTAKYSYEFASVKPV